jgi:hypothetical protein
LCLLFYLFSFIACFSVKTTSHPLCFRDMLETCLGWSDLPFYTVYKSGLLASTVYDHSNRDIWSSSTLQNLYSYPVYPTLHLLSSILLRFFFSPAHIYHDLRFDFTKGVWVSISNRSDASTSPISSEPFFPKQIRTKNIPIEELQNNQNSTFSNTQCKPILTCLLFSFASTNPSYPTVPVFSSHQLVLLLDPFVLFHIFPAAPSSRSPLSNRTPGIR